MLDHAWSGLDEGLWVLAPGPWNHGLKRESAVSQRISLVVFTETGYSQSTACKDCRQEYTYVVAVVILPAREPRPLRLLRDELGPVPKHLDPVDVRHASFPALADIVNVGEREIADLAELNDLAREHRLVVPMSD